MKIYINKFYIITVVLMFIIGYLYGKWENNLTDERINILVGLFIVVIINEKFGVFERVLRRFLK